MAKIGNETKLVLKLAKERAKVNMQALPAGYTGRPDVLEAWTLGARAGISTYMTTLDLIIIELQES